MAQGPNPGTPGGTPQPAAGGPEPKYHFKVFEIKKGATREQVEEILKQAEKAGFAYLGVPFEPKNAPFRMRLQKVAARAIA